MSTSVEARVAAHWWADRLRDEFYSAGSRVSFNVFDVLGLRADVRQLTEERINTYETGLARRIQAVLDREHDGHCDYDPAPLHCAALEEAGLVVANFALPPKTYMKFSHGHVRVSDGYDAAFIDLPLVEP